MSGLFVALEGGEGVGKSTQLELLAGWLRQQGRAVTVTREPGGTALGARIRQVLLDPAAEVTPRAEALLYAADRAHHVERVLRPALVAGDVVLTDRYVDSTLAYQGAGRQLALREVRRISEWATGGLRPDLTIVLDLDPRVGLARAVDRSAADRLEGESLAFHEAVRSAFLEFARAAPDRYAVVDAAPPAQDVFAAARAAVGRLLAASPVELAAR
jgi:dTMP kinase